MVFLYLCSQNIQIGNHEAEQNQNSSGRKGCVANKLGKRDWQKFQHRQCVLLQQATAVFGAALSYCEISIGKHKRPFS